MGKQYKNPFTLDGILKPQVGVSKDKVKAIKGLVESTMAGDRIAKGKLEETLTSTDAIFNFAYLSNLNFIPEFEEADRTWTQIAGTRRLPDFRKPVLYSLAARDWQGLGLEGDNPDGVSPVIPEGAPYPYAYMVGEEISSANGIRKRGFKTDFTFEAFINDSIGFIQALPGEMRRVALDTEEWEVYGALLQGVTTAQQLDGGTVPEPGDPVAPNSPLTRRALIRALQEIAEREVNGKKVPQRGGYNLLVPVGQAAYIQYALAVGLTGINTTNGNTQYAFDVPAYNPFGGVTIIETDWVTGTNWYLLPKPNTTARPILEHGTLIGHEVPELRVENATGTYVGGGAVSPFEGSFDNDSATFRLRQFGAGILWTPNLILWSNGTGVA